MLVIIIIISLIFSVKYTPIDLSDKEGFGFGFRNWFEDRRRENERRENERRENERRENERRATEKREADKKEAERRAGSEAAARGEAERQRQLIVQNSDYTKQVNAINNQGNKINIQYGQELTSRQNNVRKDGVEVKPGSSNILTFFIDYNGIKGNDWTQILGITADRNGSDQRYLAIWLYPGSSAFHIRTATSNGSNDTAIGPQDGNYRLTPGTHRIDVISNTIVEPNNIYQLFSVYDNKNPIIENYRTGAQRNRNNQIITDYNFPLYIFSSYGYRHQSELGTRVYDINFISGKGPFNLNDATDALNNYYKILKQVTK
jgi:hypothetical protein